MNKRMGAGQRNGCDGEMQVNERGDEPEQRRKRSRKEEKRAGILSRHCVMRRIVENATER